MRALIISPAVEDEIAAIKKYAEQHPIDPEKAIAHSKRDRAGFKRRMDAYTMFIPVGYQVTYSLEIQPPGLLRHISVSVSDRKTLPHPAAMTIICEAFGMGNLQAALDGTGPSLNLAKIWVEDFDNGHQAVNILQFVTPPVTGRA